MDSVTQVLVPFSGLRTREFQKINCGEGMLLCAREAPSLL
jgi:hypothetical protein